VTRTAGLHIHGMQPVVSISDDASNVGQNTSSLPAPGGSAIYKYLAKKEGAFVITSGPSLGGEGGSGAIASGLFGVLNVEPTGAEWYRSQLTREEMTLAIDTTIDLGEPDCGAGSDPAAGYTCDGQPILDYDAVYPAGHGYAGLPILNILSGSEIIHSDLNAVITGLGRGGFVGEAPDPTYPNRGEPFREFTVAFHDEVKVVQAFPGWFDDQTVGMGFTLASVVDGFAINYGTGGIGAEIIANRLGVGPMLDCPECKYEEFFLSGWAVGDPAMIVDVPANAGLEACDPNLNNCAAVGPKATKAFYPDDPSNVWHGYLNERTKIRNIHVGTEHHIFHLHAHQWSFAQADDDSNYLDAQALGPGSSFTYEIAYSGAGNRNKTMGDSIFHCHFYPHFAQGMWGLWRVHDTFEMGSELDGSGRVLSRGLPDAEIGGGGYAQNGTAFPGGTPVPALVPLPTKAMAPIPGAYVADIDSTPVPFMGYPFYIPGVAGHRPPTAPLDLVTTGGLPRHIIDGGTVHQVQTPLNFERELLTATGFEIPEDGTLAEKAAMAFHGPQGATPFHASYTPEGIPAGFEVNGLGPVAGSPYADPCRSDGTAYFGGALATQIGNPRVYKASVIELDAQLNKVGWHFNQQRIIVLDGDVNASLSGDRPPEPFVMRANTNDCIDFDHTNLVPSVYQMDDYQVKTPTDVIGQHIHLVKFDVTSSDGSANGWNYEDGTLSPDEVAERIHAFKAPGGSWTGSPLGTAGPRTTRQRWYIDPIFDNEGNERGLGNVFTHDHFGPSTHQQGGLYGTMLVEPEGSSWRDPETGVMFGSRADGGPTSWRADVIPAASEESYREFYLEFADFQLAYRDAAMLDAINPPGRAEVGLPFIQQRQCPPPFPPDGPCPEAISAADPGTFVVNMRNEPIATRVNDPSTNKQATGKAGDLAYAFASNVTRADPKLNAPPSAWPYSKGGAVPTGSASVGALAGDPFTPLLRAYEGDKVSLRVQVGAHEEGHNFSVHGIRWLQTFASANSGFRNSQMMGISEYFRFEVPAMGEVNGAFEHEDYLYETGSSVGARWNGSWGLMRIYDDLQANLQPLPNNLDGKLPVNKRSAKSFSGICPKSAPVRRYQVLAVTAADVLPGGTLEYNSLGGLHDPTALLYVLEDDLKRKTGKLKSNRRVEPLILRANAGDCIKIRLTNRLPATLHGPDPAYPSNSADLAGFNLLPMIVPDFNANQLAPSSSVGLHAQLVEYDMRQADGMNIGFNKERNPANGNRLTTAGPGEVIHYRWYAGKIDIDPVSGAKTGVPVEFGAINLQGADPIKHSSKGLVAALIIEPEGSTWATRGELGSDGLLTRAAVTVSPGGGAGDAAFEAFRDFVTVFQDDINMRFPDGSAVPIVSAEEEPEDSGMKAINYRTDPVWLRLGIGPTADEQITRLVDFTDAFAGDPETPIFTAAPHQPVRFRVLKPGGHNRNHVFTLNGHVWARHPFNADSTQIDGNADKTFWHGEQMGHGPTNHINVVPLDGAGGANGVTGDYLYRDMTPVHAYNGIWGIMRVQ